MRADVLAREVASRLEAVSDCSRFEAQCLLSHFCECSLSDIYCGKELQTENNTALWQAVDMRLAHQPLQYILGKWEFMGNDFYVNENVLIPRPETELLCECLADKMNPRSVVYDVCAGSGCIAVSVAKQSGAQVYALEKYEGALEVLRQNIALNQARSVQAVPCDITEPVALDLPAADMILSNPPYIESKTVAGLQQEVLKEPHTALDGGEDGLDFYRAIRQNILPLLKPGGYIAFEIGEGQAPSLRQIFSDLQLVDVLKDYSGIERVVILRKENA